MSDLEAQVVAMLRRRAADITPPSDGDEPPQPAIDAGARAESPPTDETSRTAGRRPRRRPLLIGAAAITFAAVALVAGAIAGLLAVGDDRPTLTAAGAAPEPSTGDGPPVAEPGDSAGTQASRPVSDPTVDEVLAGLPEHLDAHRGSLVFTEPGIGTVDELVDAYLADRLPDLPVEVRRVDGDGRLTLFRWSVDAADVSVGGSVLTRHGDGQVGVVAATTDGVTMTVDRTLELVTVDLTVGGMASLPDAMATVDVLDTGGAPVEGAPLPGGLGPSDQRPFGTAGWIGDGPPAEVPVDHEPIVVRARHVGGTFVSLVEYPVESVGFATACGSLPPVTIGVGDLLEPLADGPAPASDRPALPNQVVWHHRGPTASVEIRWPPDPAIVGRFDVDAQPDGSVSVTIEPSGSADGPSTRSTVVPIDPGGAGGCELVEITVVGEASTVDWWGGALSAMWSFGMPLDISELDPALGPEGIDGGSDGGGLDTDGDGRGDLVVDTIRVEAAPRVAEAGSCDGLPDAPPRRGEATDTIWDSPTSVLVTTLDSINPTLDPPLPTDGYTEVIVDDDHISYVIGAVADPIVVIDAERAGDGWRLAGWEAAPC